MSNERTSRLLAVLLVLAGLAGVLIERAQTESAGAALPAQGGFWHIATRDGRTKTVLPPSVGIHIAPGESFRLDGMYSSVTTVQSLSLRVADTGRQSGYLRIKFRDQVTATYRLAVVPGESVLGTLSYVAEGQPPQTLAEQRREGLLDDPTAPYTLTLRFDGPRVSVLIDGQELLAANDDRLRTGALTVWADDVMLYEAQVSGTWLKEDGSPGPFRYADDLRAFEGQPEPLVARLLPTLAWELAVLAAVAGWLRALALGAPPVRVLWRATFAGLAPSGALLALRPFVAVPHELLLLLLTGSIGLLFALYTLREHLRALVPSGAGGGLRVLLVVGVLAGLAGWVLGGTKAVALRPLVAVAQRSVEKLTTEPYAHREPLLLGPSNALTVPGPFRSLGLSATTTLEPDSLLELRLHAQAGLPNGVALFLSTDARWSSGFFLESKGSFMPLGDRFGVLEPGRGYALELGLDGDEYHVRLDGRAVADAHMRAFASGSVVALAARGTARLDGLSIRPVVPEPPVVDATGEAWAAASLSWMLLAVLALSAVVLLIIPLPRALEATAWMLVPIVIGVHGWADQSGRLALAPFAVTWLAFVCFALPWTLLHGHRSGALRTSAFILLTALIGLGALNKAAGPPIVNDDQKGIAWDEFDLPRIDPGLSFLEHPYIRRFNSYIIDHTFRDRRFEIEPAPGTVRVMSVGSSSTWGHGIEESTGLDYPTVLEGLLRQRLPDTRIEVINGAVRGSTAARLLRIFRESLLAFHPDIVTLSLYYNDSVYLTDVDEEAYLRRISAPDYEHTVFERAREQLDRARNKRVTDHIWRSMDKKHGDSIGSWNEVVTDPDVRSPPERFEASLRAFAELGREHGFQLVLVKEPIKSNRQRIWRDEFRAVMDRLGEEYGLPVVDPAEALAAAGGAKLFMDEVHPLPDGHRVVAEVLAPVIEKLIRERTGGR